MSIYPLSRRIKLENRGVSSRPLDLARAESIAQERRLWCHRADLRWHCPFNPVRSLQGSDADYADQEAARVNPKFFAAGGLRAGAAALPRVSLRIASDRPPRSGPIPRRHSSSLSRSQWMSSDRPFAALGGPDASAAAKDSVSDSSRDAPSRGCEVCDPRPRLLRRGPSNAKYGRGSPRGNFPIAAS